MRPWGCRGTICCCSGSEISRAGNCRTSRVQDRVTRRVVEVEIDSTSRWINCEVGTSQIKSRKPTSNTGHGASTIREAACPPIRQRQAIVEVIIIFLTGLHCRVIWFQAYIVPGHTILSVSLYNTYITFSTWRTVLQFDVESNLEDGKNNFLTINKFIFKHRRCGALRIYCQRSEMV